MGYTDRNIAENATENVAGNVVEHAAENAAEREMEIRVYDEESRREPAGSFLMRRAEIS